MLGQAVLNESFEGAIELVAWFVGYAVDTKVGATVTPVMVGNWVIGSEVEGEEVLGLRVFLEDDGELLIDGADDWVGLVDVDKGELVFEGIIVEE